MTKSGVNFNPEIPPNPTSNHQPAPLRSYRITLTSVISTRLTVLPQQTYPGQDASASSDQDNTVIPKFRVLHCYHNTTKPPQTFLCYA